MTGIPSAHSSDKKLKTATTCAHIRFVTFQTKNR